MTRKGRRLALIGSSLAIVAVALGLVLFAMRSNVTYFFSPAEIVEKNVAPGTRLRVGGLVKEGSVKKEGGQKVVFAVTDTTRDIAVTYVGLLPDLFREGQGVVAEGVLDGSGRFVADSVLAKHDENYMPPEVADALKAKGVKLGEGATHKQDKPQ